MGNYVSKNLSDFIIYQSDGKHFSQDKGSWLIYDTRVFDSDLTPDAPRFSTKEEAEAFLKSLGVSE